MDKKVLADVYSKLKSAREMVAGGNYQEFPIVIDKVKEALGFMSEEFAKCEFSECCTVLDWTNRILYAKILLEEAKEYGDRLEPDRILCDVLNEMLKVLD